MGSVHRGHRWRELVRVLCPPGSRCEVEECWCPTCRLILFGLRPRHPWGPSLDHLVELQFGGARYDPANLRPAHLSCNVRKSNRLRAEAAQARRPARRGRARSVATAARPKRSGAAFDAR